MSIWDELPEGVRADENPGALGDYVGGLMTDFHGHTPRRCGEHRTVGSHRAWCHDCGEWCYPSAPCRGCQNYTYEELEEIAERYRLAWLSARRRAANERAVRACPPCLGEEPA